MTLSIAGINKAMREVGLADESQYCLTLSDLPDDTFLIETVDLHEWTFHQDFAIELKALLRHGMPPDPLLNQPATFSILSGGASLPMHGVITACENADGNGDYDGLKLTLSSVLWLLKPTRHNRVFVDRSAVDIAKTLLSDQLGDFSTVEVAASDTPVRPLTVQFEESDFDFVTRILANEGVYLHLHQSDTDTIIQLVDDLGQLTEGETPLPLRFAPNAGAGKDDEHVFNVNRHWKSRVGTVHLSDTNPWHSEDLSVEAGVQAFENTGELSQWGANYQHREQGRHLAQVRAEAEAWPAHSLTLETTCRRLRPGSLVELIQHPEFNGSYRVIRVHLGGSQRAAAGNGLGGQDKAFYCSVTVIPADLPYRPSFTPHAPVRFNLTAWVTEEVNDRGLYRVRLPFDDRSDSDGPASLPVRMAQPLGGQDHGQHFPLAKGTEVILGFENGDIDRPVILGAHYNRQSVNPVTQANARHNLIRTRAGQRLLLDDTPEQERIELANPDNANQLTLSAEKDAHLAKLESTEGDLVLHAGRAMTFESGQNQTTTVGADHSVHVKNNQSLMTQEGSITVESATDIEYSAGKNLRWQSREGEMTLRSEGAMHWQVGDGLNQQVVDGDYEVNVEAGDYSLEADANITFSGIGSGSITLAQGDGTLQIDSSGNLTLNGPQIEVTGDTIVIKGGTIGNN
ncbi:type VI secretion system Vgr family protein [Saccharospirillum salsuginis]|uniref:Type VI secretion protein Vgr n=1 Tax=Saccharospirillum salsuginis TaxID=418750 RepID=A0A918N6H6_9GAMM|nr:type VI secretion system tip protein TssI/VgrG [Saccharospirillum salsuginis]GGX39252.1 type VI secretion protein Vgr [Saccharospirillum salsuginis]